MEKITIFKSKNLPISQIKPNSGQIAGVPKNPRLIKDQNYQKLKKSIEDNPEMLGARELLVYPLDDIFVIIGGNMRYRAAVELGYKELPCKILPPETSPEQLRAIVIKDNVAFGENDWEMLANEWESEELENWGVEIPDFDKISQEDKEDIDLSNNIKNEYKIEVICKDEEEQEKKYNNLLELGYECRLLTL